MNCETTRNRLLSEPSPIRVPAELRPHLAECTVCRDYALKLGEMNKRIRGLPVPPSDLRKIAYLESLKPAGGSRTMPRLGRPFWKVAAKPLAGLAAAIAVGFGLWSMTSRKQGIPEATAHRHDLLRKVVATNAQLAKTTDPRKRIDTLSELAADLRTETAEVLLASRQEDVDALAGMFEEVVSEGIVVQAKQLDPLKVAPGERKAILNAAADRLAAAADDANALARNAPPYAKAGLARIQEAASKGRTQLIRIADGEGA
jgi:hypothetical protein